jgi:hypothetical protein
MGKYNENGGSAGIFEASGCCCSDGTETGSDGCWFGAVVSCAEGSGTDGPGDGGDTCEVGGTLAVIQERRLTCEEE